MDVITSSGMIPILVHPECAIGAHVTFFMNNRIQRCTNCGSSLFRIYETNIPEGTYDHEICAVCNCRLGARMNAFEKELQYFNNDVDHPFECIPIKQADVDAFVLDKDSSEVPAIQFIHYLESLEYDVSTFKPIKINKEL